jgi:hypothetical protein
MTTTIGAITSLPPAVHNYVNGFVTRQRRIDALRALGVALSFSAVWILWWALLDRFFQFPQNVRAALLGLNLIAIVIICWRPMRALLRREMSWPVVSMQIERRNPRFGERLLTITSELLSPSWHRGSPEMLDHLLQEVAVEASSDRPEKLLPLSLALRPWIVVLSLALVAAALSFIPWMDMPTLLLREMLPLANIRPATTTHLDVKPGNAEVIEGQPLRISVAPQRLGDSGITLRTSTDRRTWTSVAMPYASEGLYAFTIPSIDRDLNYEVAGGDARSETYFVTVLRRPVVTKYELEYAYPAYLNMTKQTVTNTSGAVDAPMGTEATLRITASEPLQSAVMVLGDERIVTEPGADPAVRQARFIVRSTAKYDLELVSSHNIPSAGPTGLPIRAIMDRPPVVRLQLPSSDARLHPRDSLAVPYQAADDYALASLDANVQVNGSALRGVSIPIGTNAREQDGTFNLDLSALNVEIGDVVTVTIDAEDRAGQRSSSQLLRVLVSPQTIGLKTANRIEEVRESARRAERMIAELDAALKTLESAASPTTGESQPDVTGTSRHLANAAEAGRLLTRSMLRAIRQSDTPLLTAALTRQIDTTALVTGRAEHLSSTVATDPATRAAQAQQLRALVELMRPTQQTLMTLGQGEAAQALLADRQNLAAAQRAVEQSGQPRSNGFRDAIEQAKKSIASGAAALNLNPAAPEFDAQLRERAEVAAQLARSQPSPDVVAMTKQWAAAANRAEMSLDSRLLLLAQAEALRPDAQFVWARDLQLASHAVQKLAGEPSATQPAAPREQQVAQAVEQLAKAHEAAKATPTAPASAESETAREKLRELAGESATAGEFQRNENATMDATAAAVSKKFDVAQRLDRGETSSNIPTTLPANSSGSPQQVLSDAQRLDELATLQKTLETETKSANSDIQARLAQQQDALADRIEEIRRKRSPELGEDSAGDFNSRNKAMAAVRAMQQRAAALPQQFADAQKAADAARQASAAAKVASGADKANAEAHAEAAERTATEAAKLVDPALANFMSSRLRQFEPETTAALAAIDAQLRPAMNAMQQALKAGDAAAANAASQAGAQAVQNVRSQLLGAHQALADRDPLAAAQWFARQSARALAQRDGNLQVAQVDQSNAAVALSRASDQLARESATARLAALPSMMGLFAPSSPYETAPQNNELLGFLPGLPALRDWTTLRARAPEELNVGSRESDPPGYQDALRVYFGAISKLRENTERR